MCVLHASQSACHHYTYTILLHFRLYIVGFENNSLTCICSLQSAKAVGKLHFAPISTHTVVQNPSAHTQQQLAGGGFINDDTIFLLSHIYSLSHFESRHSAEALYIRTILRRRCGWETLLSFYFKTQFPMSRSREYIIFFTLAEDTLRITPRPLPARANTHIHTQIYPINFHCYSDVRFNGFPPICVYIVTSYVCGFSSHFYIIKDNQQFFLFIFCRM